MTTDIVERLRTSAEWAHCKHSMREEAAAEIERLHAEIEARKTAAEKVYLEQAADNERLRAALQNLMNDVLEYERINNLAPSPGKQDCWQSVTEARRALETKP